MCGVWGGGLQTEVDQRGLGERLCQKDCHARNLNREDAMDYSRRKKAIKVGLAFNPVKLAKLHSKCVLLSHHMVVWEILSLLCVCLSFCLFLVRLRIFQWRKKIGGMKFCMHVGILSGQVFSTFGELWSTGNHGGGSITSGMNVSYGSTASEHGMGIRNWGRRHCLRPFGRICALQACYALVSLLFVVHVAAYCRTVLSFTSIIYRTVWHRRATCMHLPSQMTPCDLRSALPDSCELLSAADWYCVVLYFQWTLADSC